MEIKELENGYMAILSVNEARYLRSLFGGSTTTKRVRIIEESGDTMADIPEATRHDIGSDIAAALYNALDEKFYMRKDE